MHYLEVFSLLSNHFGTLASIKNNNTKLEVLVDNKLQMTEQCHTKVAVWKKANAI